MIPLYNDKKSMWFVCIFGFCSYFVATTLFIRASRCVLSVTTVLFFFNWKSYIIPLMVSTHILKKSLDSFIHATIKDSIKLSFLLIKMIHTKCLATSRKMNTSLFAKIGFSTLTMKHHVFHCVYTNDLLKWH